MRWALLIKERKQALADVAYFSTDHSKVISTVLGGMVTTNNDEWATKIRAIQQSSPF